MSSDNLIKPMHNRVQSDMQEGDIALFAALSLQFEYLTKIIVAGVVACLNDDPDRHRYSLEHKLVRANAIGDWTECLILAITGRSAQFFCTESQDILRDINVRIGKEDWRYKAVEFLYAVAKDLNIEVDKLGEKTSLKQFFTIGTTIRNKTRGHGAPTAEQCTKACIPTLEAIKLLLSNLTIFKLPWAYLHRNLSGKYRVTSLLGECSCFEYLKRTKDVRLKDGVYIFLDSPIYIPLVKTNVDVIDIWLPNGQYRKSKYEILSYITNDTRRQDGSEWIEPPDRLPKSETEGRHVLDQIGNLFGNLPPRTMGYVVRTKLESILYAELLKTDRHPIVSLTGPGGIGKTTLALAALENLSKISQPPYDLIVWISARDIDLLQDGPKPVSPRVITQKDIAKATAELLEPAEMQDKNFNSSKYFQQCLADGAAGSTLFVLDNFETVENPADVFNWIDTYIRSPNKVLITTRFREFAGDYPINVEGMSEDEAQELIRRESERLDIINIINSDYIEQLYKESDGHPYVMKILLGRVADKKRAVKPERIVAGEDQILKALFERTYTNLCPAAQRTFLLLSSWRVLIPEIAVEAVSLRPRNERFNISGALEELRRFSLIEEVVSDADKQPFIGVPLAASIFGRRKLEVSPYKVAVEEDRKLLMEFGAGKREDAHRGVAPRVKRLIQALATAVSDGRKNIDDALPILEYMATKIPAIYLSLSDLIRECGEIEQSGPTAVRYLRCFLEVAEPHEKEKVWLEIADLCSATNDVLCEVHALSEAALVPTSDTESIGLIANRLNIRVRELKGQKIEDAWTVEIKQLIERVIKVMERKIESMTATDCSRLAWLYLNIGNEVQARKVSKAGLKKDSNNDYCINLIKKLEG